MYVWVNDEFTLRKVGSKTDAYEVFKSMLNAGDPPRTLETLLKHVKEMRGGGEKKLSFPRQEGFSEFWPAPCTLGKQLTLVAFGQAFRSRTKHSAVPRLL